MVDLGVLLDFCFLRLLIDNISSNCIAFNVFLLDLCDVRKLTNDSLICGLECFLIFLVFLVLFSEFIGK